MENVVLENVYKRSLFRTKIGKEHPSGQISPADGFANKVLLKHSQTHSFAYCLQLMLYFEAELNSWKRDSVAFKA